MMFAIEITAAAFALLPYSNATKARTSPKNTHNFLSILLPLTTTMANIYA